MLVSWVTKKIKIWRKH